MKKAFSSKKLLSALLITVMLFSMLPAAFAEGGTEPVTEPQLITVFTAEVPQCAVIGEHCTGYVRDSPGENYTAVGTWMTGGNVLSDADTFQENVQYNFHIEVKPREGFKLAPKFTHIHGKGFTVESPNADGNYVNDFTFLPTSAAPTPKVISELNVVLPAAPVAGEESRINSGVVANEYFYNCYWYEDRVQLLDKQVFEGGKVYSYCYQFEATDGCTFAETVKVTGLGEQPAMISRSSETTIEFSHTYPETGSPEPIPSTPLDKYITNVALTGPKAPATGDAIPAYSVSTDEYTAEGKWLVGETEVTDTQFKPETEYSLAVTITAAEGYSFDTLQSVTLDGEAMSVTKGLADAAVLHFSKTYPKTEPESTAVARIVRGGANVDYETLDAAIDDSRDGETIIILKDCSSNREKGFWLAKSINFQGSGQTISFATGFCIYHNYTVGFDKLTVNMNDIVNGSNDIGIGTFHCGIVINPNATLNVTNCNFSIQRSSGDGVYFHAGASMNFTNSIVNICNNKVNGITQDNGNCFLNVTNSTLHVDNNGWNGITGPSYVNAEIINSTVTINNNHTRGVHCGKFHVSGSSLTANNNGSDGLNLNSLVVDSNSTVTAHQNAAIGIRDTGNFVVDGTSRLTATENATAGGGAGLRLSASKKPVTSIIHAGAVIKINDNHRNGLENYRPTTIEEGVDLEIMRNYENNNGGGLFTNNPMTIPSNAKIYNNHAGLSGDDIMLRSNNASITLGSVGSDWFLDATPGTHDCQQQIDGWYVDERPSSKDDRKWNAHTLDESLRHIVPVAVGVELHGDMGIKAAHGLKAAEEHIPATVSFVKTDSVTGKPLEGVEFGLYSDESCSTLVSSLKSNAKGEFSFTQLSGTYYLKETKALEGYKPLETVCKIVITDGEGVKSELLDETVTPNEVIVKTVYSSEAVVEGLTPNAAGRYVLTNDAVLNVTIKKEWVDYTNTSKRQPVEVSLRADGKEIARYILSDDNKWMQELVLPVYNEDGEEIEYKVVELTRIKEYVVSYSKDGFTVYNTLAGLPPKTGDESNPGLWTAMLSLGLLGAAAVVFFIRKRSHN